MNDYQIKAVEEFERTILPFRGIWRSLVIRIAWTTVADIDMIVFLNATFESDAPADIRIPDYSPAVDGLSAQWFIKPASEIDGFIRDLKGSIIQADGRKFRLGQFREKKWLDGGFGFNQFARRGQAPYDTSGSPVAYLQESGSRMEEETAGRLSANGLKSAWLALPHPYRSNAEVFQEYFDMKSQAEGFAAFVHARVPIMFGDLSPDGAGLRVTAPSTVDVAKVSVGQILSCSDGTIQRGELRDEKLSWSETPRGISCRVDIAGMNDRAQRAFSVLRYGEVVLDERETEVKKTGARAVVMLPSSVGDANSKSLSADKPLGDPKDDRFGYAPFAKHLADCITQMTPSEGIVIGLYGPWGSGKSTLLNFLTHYLGQLPEAERPIVVPFNPWLFSGHEDLVQRFFGQLLGILKKWGVLAKKASKALSAFAKGVSKVPLPGFDWGETISKVLDLEPKSLSDLKTEVEEALKGQPKRILVVIDDIDRLVAEEIRQVFRLVKAVGNFPKVTYLLAFDKNVAIQAIAELQHISGEDYLEKIIQVPFELPPPEKEALQKLFFERLDQILDGTPQGLFDKTHWGNVFFEGIEHFITTPRDVMRLTNTLRVTYASVSGEVNPVDFIAIDTLRVFCPSVYEIIRSNKDQFSGYQESGRSAGLDEIKKFHEAWLKDVREADRESVKKLILRTFPRLAAVWENTYHGPEALLRWRKNLQVASPDHFPTYFRLALPAGSISASEMRLLLALTNDSATFGSRLVALAGQQNSDGSMRLRAFLDRLLDHTEGDIPDANIPAVISAFFDVGDQLLVAPDARRGMFDVDTGVRIGRIIWRLMKRIETGKRAPLLKEVILRGKAVGLSVHEVSVLGQQHGKYGSGKDSEDKHLITLAEQEELEKTVLEKIRQAATDGQLLDRPELGHILHRWRDWGGAEEVSKWAESLIVTDAALIRFIKSFLQTTYSQSISDVVSKSRRRLNPNWIKPFVDPEKIVRRLRVLEKTGNLEGDDKAAVGQFLIEYEMLQKGKNPDGAFAWQD